MVTDVVPKHFQVLKKYCRVYSISRWPFRKLKSLDKLASTVCSIQDADSVAARCAVAQGLADMRQEMQLQPSIEVKDSFTCLLLW